MTFVRKYVIVVGVLFFYTASVFAQGVSIPAGTWIYGELGETVTSKKKDTSVGDFIRASVWRNVTIDGQVVIKAGAPMIVRVSRAKKAKVAGRKGSLELEAVSVRAVDGTDVLLDGGYDKTGRGKMALSLTLFALVAWPLIFLKGKQAVLETGTVFDCSVQADTELSVEKSSRPVIKIGGGSGLSAEVLYDELDPGGNQKTLPLQLTLCGANFTEAAAVTVNGKPIKPIALKLSEIQTEDDCNTALGTIDLKKLSKLFTKGINRFEIEAGGERAEVILDVEL